MNRNVHKIPNTKVYRVVGGYGNSYIVDIGHGAILVDSGLRGFEKGILKFIRKLNKKVILVLQVQKRRYRDQVLCQPSILLPMQMVVNVCSSDLPGWNGMSKSISLIKKTNTRAQWWVFSI